MEILKTIIEILKEGLCFHDTAWGIEECFDPVKSRECFKTNEEYDKYNEHLNRIRFICEKCKTEWIGDKNDPNAPLYVKKAIAIVRADIIKRLKTCSIKPPPETLF